MSEASPSRSRRLATAAVKLAVSAALLAVLFSRVDVPRLWATARQASLLWLTAALAIYFVTTLVSAWRWHVLLEAQGVHVSRRMVLGSLLVATFFGNFLPSNIGGDVIRIRDTAKPARSKMLATMVVLVDRVLGLMGLVLVAALAATLASGGLAGRRPLIWPIWLWAGFLLAAAASAPALLAPAGFGRLLQPLAGLHPEWIGGRIDRLTSVLGRFREHPGALAVGFVGALVVQGGLIVYYLAVGHSLHIPINPADLAVIVPITFVVQLVPLSVNGFGIREATFSLYFARLGLPIESAVLMSLLATAVIMIFSLSGAAVWFARGHH